MRIANNHLTIPHISHGSLLTLVSFGFMTLLSGCLGNGTSHQDPIPLGHDIKPTPAPDSELIDEQAAEPDEIQMSKIGVHAQIEPLHVEENGALSPPKTTDRAGWWVGGPEPGERGPSVIAGHVDSFSGPAVFFNLNGMSAGDEILIDRADGTSVRFSVDRKERYNKDRFPTRSVYGPTRTSQLRLITCGGHFDAATGRYLDNTVIYAHRI